MQGVVVVNSKLHNVPTTLGNDWPLRTPGNTRTEQFYLRHQGDAATSSQRLLLLPFLLLVYSFVIFVIMQAPPGDFLTTYVATLSASGSSISGEQIEALRHTSTGSISRSSCSTCYWLRELFSGNLGLSLEYQRPNAELIGEQLGLTVALALMSFVLTWADRGAGRDLFGDASAVGGRPRADRDQLCRRRDAELHAGADPDVDRVRLFRHQRHRPVLAGVCRGAVELGARWSICWQHIWLPALVLGIAGTARLTRIMRANLLDELNKPYVVTARAKGLREWRLVLRYPVRLALNPLISTIGWYLPQLFSGSLIVATVMNLPNIGPLLLRALINQDMYLAGGILLIYSFLTIVGTLLSDIAAGADRSAHPDGELMACRDVASHRRRRPRTGSPSPPTGSWCGGASAGTTSRWPAPAC